MLILVSLSGEDRQIKKAGLTGLFLLNDDRILLVCLV